MNQYVQDIDAALQRLVDLRRLIIPNIGNNPQILDELASIQASLVNLVKARDQEDQLASNKSLHRAISSTL